jgi:hypothetical protein
MIKENDEGVNSIYYKNFCKCHNVPPHRTTIKKDKKNRVLKNLQLQNLGQGKRGGLRLWLSISAFFYLSTC